MTARVQMDMGFELEGRKYYSDYNGYLMRTGLKEPRTRELEAYVSLQSFGEGDAELIVADRDLNVQVYGERFSVID
ncbi:hypothetical protein ACFL0V_04470 [Nanoarchaeota archaeon]